MIYLPDTNILIDVITNRKGHAGLLERLLLERHMLTTCAVIVGEVYTGMRAAEEIQTRALMESLEFLPTTYEIARQGQTLSLADTTIAAVALAYQCTVITENAKDFQIPQLQLYVPWTAIDRRQKAIVCPTKQQSRPVDRQTGQVPLGKYFRFQTVLADNI